MSLLIEYARCSTQDQDQDLQAQHETLLSLALQQDRFHLDQGLTALHLGRIMGLPSVLDSLPRSCSLTQKVSRSGFREQHPTIYR